MKKKYTVYILIFLTFLLGVYSQFFFMSQGPMYNYVIKPILWIILFTIIHLFYPKINKRYNFRKNAIIEYALIAGLLYIIIYYSLGIIVGYQHTSYNRSFLGIIKNLWMILAFIVPREIIRDKFIKGTRRNKLKVFIIITFIMTLTDTTFSNYISFFNSFPAFVEGTIKTFLPAIGLNTFLTYLCYKESYISSLIYILIIEIISIIVPVFPKEIFFLSIIIEFLIPLFTYLKIENHFNQYIRASIPLNNAQTIGSKISLFVFLVVLLMFSTRLLPFMPTVIVSNSMYPHIRKGDMVIVKKGNENLNIGDIIEYKQGNILIIHRIINIKNTRDGKIYITKGDNNKNPDSVGINEYQVNGKIVTVIPKIGYPTIWARKFLEEFRGIRIEEGVR